MKIALINGSPKRKNSASSILLEDCKRLMGEKAEIVNLGIHSSLLSREVMEELDKADVWVFAFPLYVDGIPGHLLSCLLQMEETSRNPLKPHVYGIVNCGFYEGIHAKLALKLLQNWCCKTDLIWGGGMGVGGGAGLTMMPKVKPGHGPKAPIDRGLAELSDRILKRERQENQYVSMAFPRFLYTMYAQRRWRQMIKANGGKAKDLGNIPK